MSRGSVLTDRSVMQGLAVSELTGNEHIHADELVSKRSGFRSRSRNVRRGQHVGERAAIKLEMSPFGGSETARRCLTFPRSCR